jgi:PKD repeat protein
MKFKLFIILIAICAAYPAYAVQRNLEISWELPAEANVTPDGYRLYIAGQNSPACSTDQQGVTSMTCQLDIGGTSVALTMTSYIDNGAESPKSAPFTYTFIPTASLHAAFTSTSTSGQAPLLVSFNAEASTGDIDSFRWAFGDGKVGSGQNVVHTYTKAGDYTATLTITSTAGDTDSTTSHITVSLPNPENHAPKAVIIATPISGQSPLVVHFDASRSSDPDGDKLRFSWLFGDQSEETGTITTHTYTTPGLYTATLKVTDEHNSSSLTTVPIMVNKSSDEQPVAIISVRQHRLILAGVPFLFSGERSIPSSSTGKIASYQWNLGDGITATGEKIIHTYDKPGEYAVTLFIQDSDGKSTRSRLTVRVITREYLTQVLCVQQQIYRLLLKKKTVRNKQQTDKKVN